MRKGVESVDKRREKRKKERGRPSKGSLCLLHSIVLPLQSSIKYLENRNVAELFTLHTVIYSRTQ